MKILLLVSDGLVGMDLALQEILATPNCEFYIHTANWGEHKLKSLKKNGLVFSMQKFFWLKGQPSIGQVCQGRNNVQFYDGEIASFDDKQNSVLLSFGWDKKIPKQLYSQFKIAVNVHPSLLPKYRGWAPIKRAWEDKEAHGGATLHKLSEEFDKGEILKQAVVIYRDYFERKSLKQCYLGTMRGAGQITRKFLVEVEKNAGKN